MKPEELRELMLREVQRCFEQNPLIVLGTGFSIPYGIPGMAALAAHLVDKVDGSDDPLTWNKFCEVLKTADLETALQKVSLGTEMEQQVISRTWELISEADRKVFTAVRTNREFLALSKLVKHLFLSSNRRIDIVTTNYDKLAEYAVSASGYRFHTGFSDGYIQSWRPQLGTTYVRDSASNPYSVVRTAHIWKVHGSLDWFQREDEPECWPDIVSLDPAYDPLIVTPGTSKYERTYNEPFRSVMQSMDDSIGKAKAVLTVGFGFNDNHVQERLKRRCHSEKLKIYVVTKSLTESAKKFLLSGKCAEFLVLEEAHGGTMCYTESWPEGQFLPSVSFWNFSDLIGAAI